VLVELDAAAVEDLRSAVSRVDAQGLEVRIAPSVEDTATAGETFDFGLVGQDRPGIVRQVTAVLTGLDANIETFRTWITEGPETGAPLFNVEARLRLPPGLNARKVQAALEDISAEIMVDISLSPPR
jgi:glycine cleavage system regulatory protein